MGIFKYKELLFELVKREIKAKYKQSILGYAWVLLVPIVNLFVLTLVFSFFIRIQTGDVSYSLFLFAGLVPWLFTANAITYATNSLVSSSLLITKVALPRAVFPLASILSKFVDFILMFLILLLMMLFSNISFSLSLLFLPLIILVHFILVVGVSLVLSAINVYFRDVENVLGVIVSIWMYLTPVLYPPEIVPGNLRVIMNLNPMAPIINSYRNVLLYGVFPPWQSFVYSMLASVLILVSGAYFFKFLSKNFADVI